MTTDQTPHANHQAPTAVPLRAGRKEWTGLAVLLLPLLLVSMDVSVLYFAVPFIAKDLEPTSTQQLWIFDVYGFVLAGLLITMGSLGDRIGRRRLLLIGAAAFSLASLGAAYSHTAGQLIAARAVQGIAGARASSKTMNGTLIRNTEPHQKWFSRMPLSTGPSAIPLMTPPVQTVIAVRRCFSSWNMFRISASVEGISVAPAIPCTARAAMSCSAVCE